MSFLKKLFSGSETIPWESIPRNGKTFLEKQREAWEQPGMLPINHFEVYITPEEMADKACAWEVPTFYVVAGQACCFLKVASLPEPLATWLADSISNGRVTLKPTFKGFPTYPIVSLLFQVPTPERTVNLEAAPDVATADVCDSLDSLLKSGSGVFYLCVGDPLRLLAEGRFAVCVESLRACLDQAATHYKRINPTDLNYRAAAQRYFDTTSL